MKQYNIAIQRLRIPARFKKLPIDERGYPVPKFVQWIDNKPDFRCTDGEFFVRAVKHKLCWLCGEPLGKYKAFVIGPMCAINRVNSEPPSHLECARFAVKACPFLTQPQRKRNEHELPSDAEQAPGIPLARNPGVSLIWVTDTYKPFRPHQGNSGILFSLGEPTQLEWYAKGREATREEILNSIESGLPLLREAAAQDGEDGLAALQKQIQQGMKLVPA